MFAPAGANSTPESKDQGADDGPCSGPGKLPQHCLQVIAVERPRASEGQRAVILKPAETLDLRLDSALSTVPGLALFRRANSLTAHPTTQGLTMRGVGANAAGRVLVTLDGVPLNDPFGGWVYWAALDSDTLDQMAVLKGGSAGAYGAQALAGAVALTSRDPRIQHQSMETVGKLSGYVNANYGSFDTKNIRAGISYVPDGGGFLSLSGGIFETDGAYLLAERDRGTVDVPAASEAQHASLRTGFQLTENTDVTASVRWFSEDRINGLSLATNSTEALDLSLSLRRSPATGPASELTLYFRDRDFTNRFASARDERTTERTVLDQHSLPAWGMGFLGRILWDTLELGFDGRRMSGETNEYFRNLGAGFTRERLAGGDQWVLGGYMDYKDQLGDWSVAGTLRLDRWRTYAGVRQEFDLEGDLGLLRGDAIEDRGDWIWSGRVGANYQATGAIVVSAAAYKSWRLPTLNEYYRPFRVVNDITEANPGLVPETLYGIEFGVTYQPLPSVRAGATVFRNWLHDGVGNVTIGFGPGFYPLGGFVPEGGVLRQRANIDRSVTDGLELEAKLSLQNGWQLTGRYLFARARITAFAARPELVGKRPVQTPRHTAFMAASYEGIEGLRLQLDGRYSAHQFDDDLNTRRLDAIFTVNAAASYAVSKRVSLELRAENLFDAEVISAVTADGLETVAQRRMIRAGVAVTF